MANKIRRIPLRTEWLYLQHFQPSGHDFQCRILRCEGRLSLCLAQLASTQNQVLNRSCIVAIPMQNKKKMLNPFSYVLKVHTKFDNRLQASNH